MIEEVLRKRGYKVDPDSKGLLVTVPQGKKLEVAADEIEKLTIEYNYRRTISLVKENNWRW